MLPFVGQQRNRRRDDSTRCRRQIRDGHGRHHVRCKRSDDRQPAVFDACKRTPAGARGFEVHTEREGVTAHGLIEFDAVAIFAQHQRVAHKAIG